MPAEIELGCIVQDRYQILQLIGSGATAYVYLVWDQRLMKQWALKAIDTREQDYLGYDALQEARTLLTLEHPSLPRVVDVFSWMHFDIIIRDYVPGENLEEYVINHGPFTLDKLNRPLMELVEVLNYLHSLPSPLVYRDLKPANIMVKPDGQIALVDFGIARRFNPLHHADTVPLGTKGYCAPEQYCMAQTEPRTDVYGLGAILYYALTGEHLFAMPQEEVWDQFEAQEMQRAKQVIQKCMSIAVEGRYENAIDVFHALYQGSVNTACIDKSSMGGDSGGSGKIKQVLGILGIQRGVGTSHIAWRLAQELSGSGYRVLLALQHEGNCYELWWQYLDGAQYQEACLAIGHAGMRDSFKYKGVLIHSSMGSNKFLEVLDKEFDFLVMDYGATEDKLGEFLRCHRKWLVCPSTPWSIMPNNRIMQSCKGFEDLRYIANLTDDRGAADLAQWLGVKRQRVGGFPYCSLKSEGLMLHNVHCFKDIFEQKMKHSSTGWFKRRRGVD